MTRFRELQKRGTPCGPLFFTLMVELNGRPDLCSILGETANIGESRIKKQRERIPCTPGASGDGNLVLRRDYFLGQNPFFS